MTHGHVVEPLSRDAPRSDAKTRGASSRAQRACLDLEGPNSARPILAAYVLCRVICVSSSPVDLRRSGLFRPL